jgi:hypothetical protein
MANTIKSAAAVLVIAGGIAGVFAVVFLKYGK